MTQGLFTRPANRDELSPLGFLHRAARFHGGRVATEHNGERLTYAEFDDRAARLAGALTEAGVKAGERVAVLAPNGPTVLAAHFGVPRSGSVLCAINTRLSEEEIVYIVGHSGARVLIFDPSLAGPAHAAAARHGVLAWEIGTDLEDRLARADPAGAPGGVPANEDDPISVNYTSGTTGRPKGVLYTHRGAHLKALGVALESGLDINSRYLWTLPMFHCNGWCYPWAVTSVAATHVLIERPDAEVVWQHLRDGVTHLCAAPTVLSALASHREAEPLDQPVTAVTGGAPPSPTLLAKLEALGIRIVHIYGLTETYGPATVCDWPAENDGLPAAERARLRARQGVPFAAGGEVRIVDKEMQDVPRDGNTLGEVILRGNTVMAGYLDDPEATAAAFVGGWFHSGDGGVMHPDGEIELRDRFKDVIISGGENISSIEIEQVLVRHPAVDDAAVVGMPHEYWGERPKAFVAIVDGADISAEELIAFAREHLAKFKVPDAVVFGPLPRTATGKVRKNLLREPGWAERFQPASEPEGPAS